MAFSDYIRTTNPLPHDPQTPLDNVIRVGDFVEVITDKYGSSQKGDRGYVTSPSKERCWTNLNILIKFEGKGSINKAVSNYNSYTIHDLKKLRKPK